MKIKRMSKINWRREKPSIHPRQPQELRRRNKAIEPDTIYNRKKDKEILRRVYDKYGRD